MPKSVERPQRTPRAPKQRARARLRPIGGWDPTDADVAFMVRAAKAGMSRAVICRGMKASDGLPVTLQQLARAFERRPDVEAAYVRARVEADMALAETMYDLALGGSVPLLIFLGKTRLGLRETNRLEVTGADGGPVKSIQLNASASVDELKDRWAEMRKANGRVVLDQIGSPP